MKKIFILVFTIFLITLGTQKNAYAGYFEDGSTAGAMFSMKNVLFASGLEDEIAYGLHFTGKFGQTSIMSGFSLDFSIRDKEVSVDKLDFTFDWWLLDGRFFVNESFSYGGYFGPGLMLGLVLKDDYDEPWYNPVTFDIGLRTVFGLSFVLFDSYELFCEAAFNFNLIGLSFGSSDDNRVFVSYENYVGTSDWGEILTNRIDKVFNVGFRYWF